MSNMSYNTEIAEQLPPAINGLEDLLSGMKEAAAATVDMATSTGIAKYQDAAVAQQDATEVLIRSAQNFLDILNRSQKQYAAIAEISR